MIETYFTLMSFILFIQISNKQGDHKKYLPLLTGLYSAWASRMRERGGGLVIHLPRSSHFGISVAMNSCSVEQRVITYDSYVRNNDSVIAASIQYQALALSMGRESVRNILKLDLKFHPYKSMCVRS